MKKKLAYIIKLCNKINERNMMIPMAELTDSTISNYCYSSYAGFVIDISMSLDSSTSR